MTTGSSQDVLWIPLAELGRAGVHRAAAAGQRHRGYPRPGRWDGGGRSEWRGRLRDLSPAAWQKIQATNTAWQRLFHWALRNIDTPTLRRMAATADTVLDRYPDRSAPWRQALPSPASWAGAGGWQG